MSQPPRRHALAFSALCCLLLLPAARLVAQNFGEDFDGVTAPSLPPGWAALATQTPPAFATTTTSPDSPPNDAFVDDTNDNFSEQILQSPPIPITIPPGGSAQLWFRNSWDFLTDPFGNVLDGAVLEISVGGGPFADIGQSSFLLNGYNGVVFMDSNPLFNRPAWGGNSGGYQTTVATLPASADGQEVELHWILGTGGGADPTLLDGWRIDGVQVLTCPPTVVATADSSAICPTTSTTLHGVGGDSCSWSPATWLSNPNDCNPTVTPNGASGSVTYTLTVQNSQCPPGQNTGTATVTVTSASPPIAVATAGPTEVCVGSSTTLTGSGGDTCFWSPATWLSSATSCNPTVTPTGPGSVTYTLTVTNQTCNLASTNNPKVTITAVGPPVAVAGATKTSICPGGLTTLRGSGGDSCVWAPTAGLSNPNSCAPSARPTATITYGLTVTNVCGASSNGASVTITVTPRPAGPGVSAPPAASVGQTGLVASVSNPNPGSTYTWMFDPVGGATITAQNPTSIVFTANIEGTLTLSVIENDGTCLSDPTVVVITVGPACTDPQPPTDPKIQVSGNPDAPVTGIDYLDLSWTAPGTPPLFYLWSLNGNVEQTTTETSVLGQPPTGSNDPITLQVRSACSEDLASEPAEVTVSPSPPVAYFQIDSLNVSVGTPVVFTDTSAPAATSWLWLFGDGSDPETTQSVTHPFAEGTFTVFLIASNGAGSSAASQVIEVPQTVFPSTERVLATQLFDASHKNRQRLDALSFSGEGPRWLHVKSRETAHEAIAFLRFLDAAGKVVLERRLSISPGQDAVFDLNAYGLRGVYDLEVVSLRSVTASLVAAPSRQTREVRRPER